MPRKSKNLLKGKKLAGKGLKKIDTDKAFGQAVVGGAMRKLTGCGCTSMPSDPKE